jgi:uncharacterized protein
MAEPDQPQHPATSASPLPGIDRLASIDILRGIALFGVMAINVTTEFRVSIFQQFLPADRTAAPLDRIVEIILDHAVAMKAFALFSLLFGIGLAIQFERMDREHRLILLLRRLLVLLGFGLVHLTLIWNGDILTEYALAGLLALPFLFGPRWLLAAGSLTLLGIYVSGVQFLLVHLPDRDWIARHVQEATHVYGSGSVGDILVFRLQEIGVITPLHLWIFPRTLGLFLLGAFIWRCGVLQRAAANCIWFVVAGLAALVITLDAGSLLATVTLALAYAAFIIGAASTPIGARLLGWAAPLGRMAFTNYLMQSLIFGVVFYGYGLALFGKLGAAAALGLGSVVYIAQMVASRWWLSRFNFGPVEWLWRTLMYGRRPPIKSASSVSHAAVAAA